MQVGQSDYLLLLQEPCLALRLRSLFLSESPLVTGTAGLTTGRPLCPLAPSSVALIMAALSATGLLSGERLFDLCCPVLPVVLLRFAELVVWASTLKAVIPTSSALSIISLFISVVFLIGYVNYRYGNY